MKINNVEVIGNRFTYDGCHKIYVIENQEDEQKSRECGYEILDISQLIKRIKIVVNLDLFVIGN